MLISTLYIMKKLFFICCFAFTSLHSQTYVKVNALTTLLTIPNVGIETSIGKNQLFN
jgi:hypothetical protein